MNVEEAISDFLADLDLLFAGIMDNGYNQFVYFPPEVRAKIMLAGRTQTQLKVRYQGADRIIEPYSLKYLERKNGEAREYFYVYNCSGGKSPPNIRSFLPEGLEEIENTDGKFTPRFQIELSKAGEMPENPYLFDPNKPTKAPSRKRTFGVLKSRRHVSFGPKYIYQCGFCGKKFIKSKYDSNLREHKDKNGYRCGGRNGYYIGTKY